jgi:hypothetical protein
MDDVLRFEFSVEIRHTRHIRAKRKQAMQNISHLYQSLILAHQIDIMFHDGQIQSFEQISQWLGISPARVSQVINLLLLSTRIQEEIFLSNQAKVKMVKENEAREIALKVDWEEQWRCWEKIQIPA